MHMRMHGWRAGEEEEERKREGRRRHMWTFPPRGSAILASVGDGGSVSPLSSSSLSSSPNSATFFKTKDGRKISVGDCALFNPPQDSPPFIGIIRSLTAGKENKLTLSVNWLYRPAEVKLGKGLLLEAAPNEIFFSFHKDEILAASLLHPCKVAFLPKGIELPSGTGSFVCRKVYDITNRCLWWLTDQDYINKRQEEVDKLLYKTRIEMHATVPSGGHSPKPMNGPTSISQLKPGSDSAQNIASFPSQVKGKKRERGDQSSEPVKRERSSKMEEGDSGHSRTESNLKTEIAKITEKGRLVDYDGVEKLVQLMVPEKSDKKVDLVCRSLLAGVVAVTDKFDCLNRFVQLRGLPVFDEWLQEIHKGKIGDSSSPKDGDKSVEEFLLILLRALDKLPVNLHALQMCNIGKSVNHLRTHKNVEIQKKSRSLVDTWKKRVEVEMDAIASANQAVSWPARPRLPEVPHHGNRHSAGSSEVAVKSLVAQPAASKTASVKLVQGDTLTKSTFSSPVSMKSTPIPASGSTNPIDGKPQNAASAAGTTDLPLTPAKDEKDSSSCPSHNNGQSWSSDHPKTGGFSGKEDAGSSATVSMANKISACSSWSQKSVNGFPGSTPSGVQIEAGLSKSSSLHRNSASDRLSQPSVICEKALDVPMVEGSNPKIIVKIPNRGRSPAHNSSGGSVEDPSITNSRAYSPVLSEKQSQFDHNFREKNDALQADISSNVNNESWQSNVNKDAAACPDEGNGSHAVLPDEKGCLTVIEDSEDISLPPGYEFKNVKLQESSFSSMNALIESCVKYSEANVSAPVGDDIGMNLLASVAAGEMSKSDVVSPIGSPPRTPVHEPLCDDSDSRVKSFTGDDSTDGTDDEHEKQVMDSNLWAKNADSNPEKLAGDLTAHISTSPMDLQQSGDPYQENIESSKEIVMAETPVGARRNPEEDKVAVRVDAYGTSDTKQKISVSLLTEDKVSESTQGVEIEAVKGSSSHRSLEFEGENKKTVSEGLNSSVQTEQKPPPITTHTDSLKGTDGELPHTSGPGEDVGLENIDKVKAEKDDEVDSKSHIYSREEQKSEWTGNVPMIHEELVVPMIHEELVVPLVVPRVGSADNEGDHVDNLEVKEVKEQCCAATAPPGASTALRVQETGQHVRTGAPKLTSSEGDKAEESTSTTIDASSSAAGASAMEAKVGFDLNEGFDGDDGKFGESNHFTAPGCSGAAQQLISPLPLPVSSVSSSLPASITVAAAAKGPFVPPEDLLSTKGALGWKGSASTSAFRPAKPRKVLEMPLWVTNVSLPDATPGKHSRPLLDIDLNVPDERVLEDLASRKSTQDTVSVSDLTNTRDRSCCEVMGPMAVRGSGGLDLDLNIAEEHIDISNCSTSNGHKPDVPLETGTSSGGLLNGEVSVRRDFDLNGPVVDETSAEPSFFHQHPRYVPSEAPFSGFQLSSAESGNFSSWFPRGNTYSTITIPSVLPNRGEQLFPIITPGTPQRMLAPPTSGSPYVPDVFRGPVLSSSPAVPFPSASFQYPVFPFGTSFPLPSATFSVGSTTYVDSSSGGRLCFPAVNSQVMGAAGAVPSHFPRRYVVSFPEGSNSASTEGGLRWSRQGLDLNAGPGVLDVEGRDETSVPRQLSVTGPQALTDDQVITYQQMAGGHLKRKESEGGWDGSKRPPCQ